MPRAKKQPRSPYGVHPGVLMVKDWIAKLPEKTGKSLDEWLRLVRTEGPAGGRERREWLKKVHKLGTNSAWWIAERAEGQGEEDGDPDAYLLAAPGMVDAMFAGPKARLRPLYERLLELALDLGADVKACPCKTIVPLYRNHVFAQIKPATRTRIDFGLALGNVKATGRLIDTGGLAKKDRITHRLAVSTPADVDEELKHWLRAAYDRDA